MLEKMKMTGDGSTPKRQYYLLTSKLLINGDESLGFCGSPSETEILQSASSDDFILREARFTPYGEYARSRQGGWRGTLITTEGKSFLPI